MNPAPVSVESGHYYQGRRGRQFWQRLERWGLLIRRPGQWVEDNAVECAFGFTEVVKLKRPTTAAAGLSPGERQHGAALLLDKLIALDTKAVVFTFKGAAEAVTGGVRGLGWQDDGRLAGADVFVLPVPYKARFRVDDALQSLADRLHN